MISADTSAAVAAIAAVASALFAAATFFLYWREQRSRRNPPAPIVECQGNWMQLKNCSDMAYFTFTVRNRAPCTLEVRTVRAVKPDDMLIAKAPPEGVANPSDGQTQIEQSVHPAGTDFLQFGRFRITDSSTFSVHCRLPGSFQKGDIAFDIQMEERDGSRRRIVKRTHARLGTRPPRIAESKTLIAGRDFPV